MQQPLSYADTQDTAAQALLSGESWPSGLLQHFCSLPDSEVLNTMSSVPGALSTNELQPNGACPKTVFVDSVSDVAVAKSTTPPAYTSHLLPSGNFVEPLMAEAPQPLCSGPCAASDNSVFNSLIRAACKDGLLAWENDSTDSIPSVPLLIPAPSGAPEQVAAAATVGGGPEVAASRTSQHAQVAQQSMATSPQNIVPDKGWCACIIGCSEGADVPRAQDVSRAVRGGNAQQPSSPSPSSVRTSCAHFEGPSRARGSVPKQRAATPSCRTLAPKTSALAAIMQQMEAYVPVVLSKLCITSKMDKQEHEIEVGTTSKIIEEELDQAGNDQGSGATAPPVQTAAVTGAPSSNAAVTQHSTARPSSVQLPAKLVQDTRSPYHAIASQVDNILPSLRYSTYMDSGTPQEFKQDIESCSSLMSTVAVLDSPDDVDVSLVYDISDFSDRHHASRMSLAADGVSSLLRISNSRILA